MRRCEKSVERLHRLNGYAHQSDLLCPVRVGADVSLVKRAFGTDSDDGKRNNYTYTGALPRAPWFSYPLTRGAVTFDREQIATQFLERAAPAEILICR